MYKYGPTLQRVSNRYKSGDKKIGRREGTQPIKRVLTYVLFSVTRKQNDLKLKNEIINNTTYLRFHNCIRFLYCTFLIHFMVVSCTIMNAGAAFRTKVSSNCHDLVTLKKGNYSLYPTLISVTLVTLS